MVKKFLSLFMAVIMIIGILPVSAYATGDAETAAEGTYTVTILENENPAKTVTFTTRRNETTNDLEATSQDAQASVSGTTITLVAKTSTATYTLTISVNINDGDAPVSVTTTAVPNKGSAVSVSGEAIPFVDGAATVSAFTGQTQDITVVVNWNDNNDQSGIRPSEEDLAASLVLKDGSGSAVNVTPVKASASTYNEWFFIYEDLTGSGYTVELPIQDGYLTPEISTADDGKITVRNTLEAELTVTKQWLDVSSAEVTRPDPSAYLSSLTLYRGTETISNGEVSVTENGNLWTLDFQGLPAFDPLGNPYTYSVQDSYQYKNGTDTTWGHYLTEYENVGSYATVTDRVYDGGIIQSTIYCERIFSFYKVWNESPAVEATDRPNITFRLFRYPVGGSMDDASPVQGMDTMTLTGDQSSTGSLIAYTVNGETVLPMYDNTGTRYLYFVRETIENNENYGYEKTYNNAASTDKDAYAREGLPVGEVDTVLFDGGTVTNTISDTQTITVTKAWKAKALQGADVTVTMGLYHKVDGVWQPYQVGGEHYTVTQTSTIGGALDSEFVFSGLPFDEEYAVFEISVSMNRETAEAPNGYFADGETYTVGGHSFRANYPAESVQAIEETYKTVTNTLIGETEFLIKKNWSPDLAAGVTGSITVRVFRDGANITSTLTGLTTQNGVNAQLTAEGLVLSNMAEDSSYLLIGLPKYNDVGAEYTYTIEETSHTTSQEPQYGFADLSYSTTSSYALSGKTYTNVLTGTLTNVYGPGNSAEIEITKEWLDDKDVNNREAMTVQVTYTSAGESLPEPKTVVLSSDNNWRTTVSVPTDATDFVVRETKIGDNTVTYDEETDKGSVTTDKYKYQTWTVGSGRIFSIKNLRIGTVDITIQKTWKVGSVLTGLTAHFQVLRENPDGTETVMEGYGDVQLVQPAEGTEASSITIQGLPKFDNQGRLYSYRVVETKLTQTTPEGTVAYTFDAKKQIQIGDLTVTSSGGMDSYTAGTAGEADEVCYSFKNIASGKMNSVHINKVWRDSGSGDTIRPDIVIKLYRSTATWAEITADPSAYAVSANLVTTDQIWDTTPNDWYWQCYFGDLDRFDPEGNEYIYFVTETMPHPGDYKIAYYNGNASIDANGTDTQNTFEVETNALSVPGVARASYSGSNIPAGVIVNYLEATCSVTGRKIWANRPAWYALQDLPDIYVWLYRDGVKLDGDPVCLADGQMTYSFGQDDNGDDILPKYDQWGRLYSYTVQETANEAGTAMQHPGYAAAVIAPSSITNTYVDSQNVSVTVTKNWNWRSWKEGDIKTYPAVTYELWQRYEGNKGEIRTRMATSQTVEGDTIPRDKALTQPNVVSFTGLPYYAPNGKPFEYYIKESVSGYTTTYSVDGGEITLSGEDTDGYSGSITVTNTYIPGQEYTLTVTKNWDDFNNQYGTRPEHSDVTLTLYRKTKSISKETVSVLEDSGDVNWSISAEGVWTYTFTGGTDSTGVQETFPTHAPNGEVYTYFVEEMMPEAYNTAYSYSSKQTGSSPVSLTVTNTLLTEPYYVQELWNTEDESLSFREIQNMVDLGLLTELSFTVQEKNSDGDWVNSNTPDAVGTTLTVSFDGASIKSHADTGRNFTVCEELPKYRIVKNSGVAVATEIDYRAVQTTINNMAVADDGTCRDYTVTATEKNESVSKISVKIAMVQIWFQKSWEDENNRDGIRPASVEYTVTNNTDSEETIRLTLTADNDWKTSISVPASSADGFASAFTTTESAPAGYAAGQVSGTGAVSDPIRIANTHTHAVTSLTATKEWDDLDNRYGTRKAVEVQLQQRVKGSNAKWEVVGTATLTESGNWTYIWDNLDVCYDDSDAATVSYYEYRVVETNAAELPNYTGSTETSAVSTAIAADGTAVGTLSVKLTNTLQTTNLTVTKVWEDQTDVWGLRPGNVTVKLQRTTATNPTETDWMDVSGTGFGEDGISVTMTISDTTWTGEWDDLPAEDTDGNTYSYRAVETDISTDYTSASTVEGSICTITNTLKTKVVSLTIDWADDDNRDGLRPEEPIQLTVTMDAEKVFTYTLTGEESWMQNLVVPSEHSFIVTEPAIPAGYEASVEGFKVTNTHSIYTVNVEAIKLWTDDDAFADTFRENVELTLQWSTDGGLTFEDYPEDAVRTVTLADGKATWSNLPANTKKANASDAVVACVYRVVEKVVPDSYAETYSEAVVAGNTQNGNTLTMLVTNTFQTTSLAVSLKWEDQADVWNLRPASTEVKLQWSVDGDNWSDVPNVNAVQLLAEENWMGKSFDGLPMVDTAGTSLQYRAVEVTPSDDYTTSSVGGVITDTLKTKTVTLTKLWEDENNRDGVRPETIELTVTMENNSTMTCTLAAAENWELDIEVPLTHTYTVSEENPPTGYTASVNGFTVTNSRPIDRTSLAVTKVWTDDDNRWNTRPETDELLLVLKCSIDGVTWTDVMGVAPTITDNGDGTWTILYEGLPVNAKKQTAIEEMVELRYRVTEVSSPMYIPTYGEPDRNDEGTWTQKVENRLETVTLTVEKVWEDSEDRWNTRPMADISLVLQWSTDGVNWETVPHITAQSIRYDAVTDTWGKVVYEDLPKSVTEGVIIQYRAVEAEVPAGYEQTVAVDNYFCTITNSLIRVLMVDNITANAADENRTDMGGFVVISDGTAQRDVDGYQQNQFMVSWWPEEGYQFTGTFTVEYLEHGQAEWTSVSITDITDLSALWSRFPDVQLRSDGRYTLLLAADASEMPKQTKILVEFAPTLATENTTRRDNGGQVQVMGGVWDDSSDGVSNDRYSQTIVLAQADAGWYVDLSNLQLGTPGAVNGEVDDNENAQTIVLDADGRFSMNYTTTIAGIEETIVVSGKVEVTSRDSDGRPVEIKITLDELPVPLDIGISFLKVPIIGSIPNTGDPMMSWVYTMLISLFGMAVAVFCFRRKKT